MAEWQAEVGAHAVTCTVSMSAEGEVHFEAFQVSEQCTRLAKEGWFVPGPEDAVPGSSIKLRNPAHPDDSTPIVLPNGKDVGEVGQAFALLRVSGRLRTSALMLWSNRQVDPEWFVLPVNILDHEGPLRTVFPVENRLLGQHPEDLQRIIKVRGAGSERGHQGAAGATASSVSC